MTASERERIRREAIARTARDHRDAVSSAGGRPITQTQALARVQQAERKRED